MPTLSAMLFPQAIKLPPDVVGSAIAQWREYFAKCLRATHPKIFLAHLPLRVLAIARALYLFKAYTEVRFVRLFERWIFPNRKRKALLIGIRAEQDLNTVTLNGPHKDVAAMKELLISACYPPPRLLFNQHHLP